MIERLLSYRSLTVLMFACLAMPFIVQAYFAVGINATADHMIIYRWIDAIWNGASGLYLIDIESPRFLVQYIVGFFGYWITFGDPFGTSFVIAIAEVIGFVAAIAVLKASLRPSWVEVCTFLFITLIVFWLLQITGAVHPNWTGLVAIIHPMRHTSAMVASIAGIALFFYLHRKQVWLQDLGWSTIAWVLVLGVFVALSDKLFMIWGAAVAVIILGMWRLVELALNATKKVLLNSLIELGLAAFIFLAIYFLSEIIRGQVISVAGAHGLVGVTSSSIVANLKSSDVLVPRVFAIFSRKEPIYFVICAFICFQAFFEQVGRLPILAETPFFQFTRKHFDFVGTKMAGVCLALFLTCLVGMVAAKAINYRYLEFLDIMIFVAFALILHAHFKALLMVKTDAVERFGRVGFVAMMVIAFALSSATSLSIADKSRKTHRFSELTTWLESQFEDQTKVAGLSHYWLAHEVNALSDKIELFSMDKKKLQTYPRWQNIGNYFFQRGDCLDVKPVRFILNEGGFGDYKQEDIRRQFGEEDRLLCSDRNCRFELYVYDQGVDVTNLLEVGAGARSGELTMRHSINELMARIKPEANLCK